MTSPVHVFFFRGLSTYGQDDARFSVFNFGPMAKNIVRAFGERGVIVHPVEGMGAGTLEEMAGRARRWIESHNIWLEGESPIHFCGHSAGGLVARLVLHDLGSRADGKVASLLTFGTPNSGSEIARICIDMPKSSRTSLNLLRTVGYDVARNGKFFAELTPERVAGLPQPANKNVRVASVVCHSPRAQFCLPLKLFYQIPAFRSFAAESDGFVERASQPLGEVIAEVNIDHFRQLGLFGDRERFARLCDVMTDYFKKFPC